jgi:hypothetical protein
MVARRWWGASRREYAMTYKNIAAAVAAFAFAAVPTMASAASASSANPAAALSLSPNARSASPTNGKSRLAGNGRIIAIVLALGVVAGGIIAIADSNDNPASS